MSQDQFEHELNGQKVFTGMKTPETMPLSFQSFPKPKMRSLDDIAEIVKESKTIPIEQAWGDKVNWFNQGRRSSCNAYMIAWILAIVIWRQTGKFVRFSPEWVYSKINGGKDGGSMLDDGMIETFEGGMPEFDEAFYEVFKMNNFSMEQQRWATENSTNHCFAECYKAPNESFEEMVIALLSCLADGGAIGTALHVGSNYMKSGKDAGFDEGLGNHAVAGGEVVLLTDRPKSIEDFRVKAPQTWGSRFANKGFTNVNPSKHYYKPGSVHAFYCVTAVSAIKDVIDACRIR